MKKTTQKIAALIAAFSLTFPAYSFADDAAPEPANAPAAESAQAETAEVNLHRDGQHDNKTGQIRSGI